MAWEFDPERVVFDRQRGLLFESEETLVPGWIDHIDLWIAAANTQVAADEAAEEKRRADRVARRVRAMRGDVALFSSGHFLRVFAARWLGLEPGAGRYFLLGTASLSAVGYEHGWSEPVIRLWNEIPHPGRMSPAQVRGHGEEARR